MKAKVLCPKCNSQHSLSLKETKTYECGITIVGTCWDASSDSLDRMFCFGDLDDLREESGSRFYEYLKSQNFPDAIVINCNPYYGKWKNCCFEVISRGDDFDHLIPLFWEDYPVLVCHEDLERIDNDDIDEYGFSGDWWKK